MNEDHEDHEDEFSLVCPFWIDTDAYTDRDRVMFTAGVEFQSLLEHVRKSREGLKTTIHRENESRVRMACARFKRTCRIEPCEEEHDPDGTWSYLEVEAV